MTKKEKQFAAEAESVAVAKSVTIFANFSGQTVLPWSFYDSLETLNPFTNIEKERYGLLEAFVAQKQGWIK